jgi:hypothetical protein
MLGISNFMPVRDNDVVCNWTKRQSVMFGDVTRCTKESQGDSEVAIGPSRLLVEDSRPSPAN